MSGIEVSSACRRRIQPQLFARNGQVVSAQLQQAICESLNQVAFYRTKEYFASSGDVTGLVTGKTWRFAGHIGPVAKSVVARILMAPADFSGAPQTNNPRVQMTLHDTSGNLITSGSAYYGYTYQNTPNNTPDEYGVATIGLNVQRYRDTSFRATLVASESARPISCTVYETAYAPTRVDDLGNTPDNWYCAQAYSGGQPIFDEDRSKPQNLAHKIYKRGGATVFTFSSNTDATAPTWTADFSGTGYVNWIDGFGVNSLGRAQRPGFTVDLRYCNRKTQTTVPVKLEAYAAHAGAGATIRIVDELGNVHATWAGVVGSAAWQTPQTANLPADQRQYQIDMLGNAGVPVTLYALSCYQYA